MRLVIKQVKTNQNSQNRYLSTCLNYKVAVRRELVFDECGGALRRRRQAHAFYLLNLINCQIDTIILTTNN